MIDLLQVLGSAFAFLLGLAFGSFLNVVVTRLPENESVLRPGSHCRVCDHRLSWWENIPLLSYVLLHGRCRKCHTRISCRYPLVELAMALLWTGIWIGVGTPLVNASPSRGAPSVVFVFLHLAMVGLFAWLLAALALLDAEHLWLPDRLTYPGIALGLLSTLVSSGTTYNFLLAVPFPKNMQALTGSVWPRAVEAFVAAGLILIIRLVYWIFRRREGMGLGDAKLMGLLGAWLGLEGALESFAVAVLAATAAAMVWLVILVARRRSQEWAQLPLPLGTFLCLAALTEIFYPGWLFSLWSRTFLY